MRRTIILVALPLVALAGCSGGSSQSTPASAAPSSSPSVPSADPSPSKSYATPQQLASVVAMRETDWREVIDGAYECRLLWVQEEGADDPVIGAQALTCHLTEGTMTMTAEMGVRELQALEPDPSMESLVAKTIAALQAVAAADVEGQCASEARTTPACNGAHLAALSAYSSLETALDGWKPYL